MRISIDDVGYDVTDEAINTISQEIFGLGLDFYNKQNIGVRIFIQGLVRTGLFKIGLDVPVPKGGDLIHATVELLAPYVSEGLRDVELSFRFSEQDHTITSITFPYDVSSTSEGGRQLGSTREKR